jgi:hypothetical protein
LSPAAEKVTLLTVPTDPNTFYFPLEKIRQNSGSRESLDSFVNRGYSGMLFYLKEPILFNYSGPREIYRFFFAPSIYNFPVSLTISKESDHISMTAKAHHHWEGYKPETINIDTTFSVSPADWDSFYALLKKTNFWNVPTDTIDRGFDGSDWILEGTKGGNYHFVDRWSPDQKRYPEFRACCEYLRSLARKSVDFHHEF